MARPKSRFPSAFVIANLIDSGGRLKVRATPNASSDAIAVTEKSGAAILSVRTTATPKQGEANQAVLALIAKALGCPPSTLTVLRGHSSRDKIIQIHEIPYS
jgi:uncharacterized protein YggU (UPF0235/DUF167 family)